MKLLEKVHVLVKDFPYSSTKEGNQNIYVEINSCKYVISSI